MKTRNILFLTAFLLLQSVLHTVAQAQDQNAVLLTIGGQSISRGDFEKIYHKNNSKDVSGDKKSLQDYLDLYINYKLKVKEAEELALDTAANFKGELNGYRKQLAQPYLTDKEASDNLVREAYNRMKTDIRASHILIKVTPDALPKDTLKAYARILKIRDLILKNGDFSQVARDSSEDPSAKENAGDLGYFTALQMVYPFENAAYNAEPGKVTMPVRTRFGYHLIKVTGSRANQGEVTVAHIMVKDGAKATPEESIKAKTKIEELSKRLKVGESFETLAKNESEDLGSARNGGVLPAFGSGRMVPEFENVAFAMVNKGDVSEPVKTAYGWHIIKLIDRKGIGSFEELASDLKTRINKDSRSDIGRSSFLVKVKKEYNLTEIPKMKEAFYKAVDSTLVEGTWSPEKASKLNSTLFTLLDKSYNQADFARFMAEHQTKKKDVSPSALVDQFYEQYVNDCCMNLKESRLELEYPDFKSLMEEYRDGILLFELTDRTVWSKAVKDTAGLKAYYEQNKAKYMWDDRADADIYTCASEAAAKLVKKAAKKGNDYEVVSSNVNQNKKLNDPHAVSSRSARFNKGENEYLGKVLWKKGLAPMFAADGKFILVNFRAVLPAQPKTLEEAKGIVTADYQGVLEKQWIDTLRSKYKWNLNQEVLQQVK